MWDVKQETVMGTIIKICSKKKESKNQDQRTIIHRTNLRKKTFETSNIFKHKNMIAKPVERCCKNTVKINFKKEVRQKSSEETKLLQS